MSEDRTLFWLEKGKCPLYLAPMARYTDAVYRQLCKEQGADVMVTEFVLADSIVRGGPKVWDMVDFTEGQRPMGIQLFGCNPTTLSEAAKMVCDRMNPDFLDINFGCPAKCVTENNGGSSLLRNLPLLKEIVACAVKAVPDFPVTCKMRIGWDEQSIVALDAAKMMEDVGAKAVAIHGRTKEQGYGGRANWEVIESVAQALTIPVIGNGDVRSHLEVDKILRKSPVAGIMIGRAALGNPWIFSEIKHFLKTGEVKPRPLLAERWQVLLRYARLLLDRPARRHKQDDVRWMRPRLLAMTKDMYGSRELRRGMGTANSLGELEDFAVWHQEKFSEAEVEYRRKLALSQHSTS